MVFAMFHFQVHLECVVYDSIYTNFFENWAWICVSVGLRFDNIVFQQNDSCSILWYKSNQIWYPTAPQIQSHNLSVVEICPPMPSG